MSNEIKLYADDTMNNRTAGLHLIGLVEVITKKPSPMNQITQPQQKSLEDKIYNLLMDNPEMGMGEMGDCQLAARTLVLDWIEENNIEVTEN
jgi:hypothetical protein